MDTIRQILQVKGAFIWTIQQENNVFEALRLMAEKDVGALPVMDGEKLVGVITERDYSRKVILRGKASRDTKVSEIMVRDFPFIHPDQTVEECMELMTGRHSHYLLVMEGDDLIGIVSAGDVMRNIIYLQRKKLSLLESRSMTSMMV